MERRERRERWFRLGQRAATAAYGCAIEGYVCPLCSGVWPIEALESKHLTGEHVPPKGLGGRELVLTCRTCNTLQGAALDRHAVDEQKFLRAAQMEIGTTRRVVWNGIRSDLAVVEGEDGEPTILITGVPGANSPAAMSAAFAPLDEAAAAGSDGSNLQFHIELEDRAHIPRATLSYLRAAYLAGFAVFGYGWALTGPLEPLREQLRRPDEVIVTPTVLMAEDDSPAMAIITPPDWPPTLAVTLGYRQIMLPYQWSGRDFFDGLIEHRQNLPPGPVTIESIDIRWPTGPIHAWDLD